MARSLEWAASIPERLDGRSGENTSLMAWHFHENRRHVLTDMDLSGDEVQQRAEADRREVNPPIQVETATWSKAGQLDWWMERTAGDGGAAYAVPTVGNGGSEPLIFARPQASERASGLDRSREASP
jgi:hypothetical protein